MDTPNPSVDAAGASEDAPAPRRRAAERRRHFHTLDRRRSLLLAAAAGAAAGCVAVLLRVLAEVAEAWCRTVGSGTSVGAIEAIATCALLAGGAGYLTQRFCPEAGGSGIPQIKANLAGATDLRAGRILGVKLIGGFMALAGGLSVGREGPTIHLGGATGALLGSLFRVPKRTKAALVAAGSGAGLAAAFNAPLAGFLFVMEELKRDMGPVTYGTALIGSVSSVVVCRYVLGQQSIFQLSDPAPLPLKELPLVAIVGLLCGITGVVFNKGIIAGRSARERFRIPRWGAGLLVGGMAGACLRWFPGIASSGNTVASEVLGGKLVGQEIVAFVLALLAGKLVFTWLSYAVGAPGGMFAPLLMLGSLVGLSVGEVAHQITPHMGTYPLLLATVGMAAMLAGAIRAPLTSVVMVVEMTGEYHLVFALLLAAFAADVIADLLRDKPIYEALMEMDIGRPEEHERHEAEFLELMISPNSRMDGRTVKNSGLPAGCLIAMVDRDGHTFAPSGSTVLEPGDHLTVVVSPSVDRHGLIDLAESVRA